MEEKSYKDKKIEDIEESIIQFRKSVAEKEGISEEEAADKILIPVKWGLEIFDDVMSLSKKLNEIAERDKREYWVLLESTIHFLLVQNLTVEGQRKILEDILQAIEKEK